MTSLVKQIQKALKDNGTLEAAAAYKKLVPGNQKIYGVRTLVLDELSKKNAKNH